MQYVYRPLKLNPPGLWKSKEGINHQSAVLQDYHLIERAPLSSENPESRRIQEGPQRRRGTLFIFDDDEIVAAKCSAVSCSVTCSNC